MTSGKIDNLPKYTDSRSSGKSKPVDHSTSGSVEVWYGRNLWKYSVGPVGLITHRKCLLDISGGQLSLRKGKSVVFNSPIHKVKVENLSRNFGGLKLTVDGKGYTILFYRPFYPVFTDLRVSRTTKWMQLLLSAGASDT
jgi:hypothetical protein